MHGAIDEITDCLKVIKLINILIPLYIVSGGFIHSTATLQDYDG